MAWVDDTFTGSNGDAPNTDKWVETDSNNKLSIQNNALDFDAQESSDVVADITSTFEISGDFDIQVDITELHGSAPSSSISSAYMQIISGAINSLLMMGWSTTARRWYVSGSSTAFSGIDRSLTTSKIRFVRAGSTIKGYYWSGSQWEWNSSTAGYTFAESHTDNVKIRLYTKQEGDGANRWHVAWDNFVVNSGNVTLNMLQEDFLLDLAVQANAFDYFKMILAVIEGAWVEDFKLNLGVVAQVRDSFRMLLEVALSKLDDFKMLLEVSDGTVFDNFAMLLAVTDGTVFDYFKMELGVVSASPAFRSVTAHRVSSVVHEVV